MNPEGRNTFLQGLRPAVFSTISVSGGVHSVLVWYMWDGESFTVLTDRGSVKHRNVERTGRATITVHEEIAYVSAEGAVEVRSQVPFEERLALWTRYRGEKTARQVVTAGSTERMIALVLKPGSWIEVLAG